MEKNPHQISEQIKQLATELGFTACGFAPANFLDKDAKQLKEWIKSGMHAGMHYMEGHFEKRVNPSVLVPGAKSVIVVLLNYFPKENIDDRDLIISKYAYGRDYHKVMKSMLKEFYRLINEKIVQINGRSFVDSAPVLERALASMAGLGWIGKHANLISPKHGSFCFIGEIIVDIELEYARTLPDYCGGCNKCIDACPTGAIISPAVIDSRKCISYWTIEHKGNIDPALAGKFENRIFGCDICQDVCPWNRKSRSTPVRDFEPSPDLLAMTIPKWESLTEEQFDSMFKGSAVKRTKYEGIMRNIRFLTPSAT